LNFREIPQNSTCQSGLQALNHPALGVLAHSVSTPLRVPRKQVIELDLLDIPTGHSERKEEIAR
jgi:hypothetical protein